MTLAISLQPEYVGHIGGFGISNSFVASVLVTVLLLVVLAFEAIRGKRDSFIVRSTRFFLFQALRMSELLLGSRKKAEAVIPLVATFFVFIMTANLLALVPGFLGSFFIETSTGRVPLLRSPNSDINTTLALALMAVVMTQYYSLRALGIGAYVRRFIDFKTPITFVLGFFEFISESVKVLSFSFRLFGNVFAGEVLLLIIAFLVPYLVPVPFMILEMFVGIIQAFIFAVLTLSFIRTASISR